MLLYSRPTYRIAAQHLQIASAVIIPRSVICLAHRGIEWRPRLICATHRMAKESHDGILALVIVVCAEYIKLVLAYLWEWIHWIGDRSPSTPGLKIITGSTRFMPMMEKKLSDKHWDSTIARKPFRTPNDVLAHLKQCEYRTHYVEMERDGTNIATDVMLPTINVQKSQKLPAVFFQTRYMRGMRLRWPLKKFTNGRPVDLINFELKAALLAAGYAVVTIDVRGTGASYGQWRIPWSPEERDDSVEIIEWITRQKWSNGQVVLSGVSYEASAALFTLSKHPPAVKGCLAQYPFWDLFNDIAMPGGIANKSFVREWDGFCAAMDSNDFSKLPRHSAIPLMLISKGCALVIENGADDSAAAAEEEKSPADSNGTSQAEAGVWIKNNKAGKADGRRRLREALKAHKSWKPADSASVLRFTDQLDVSGCTAPQISACSVSREIASSGIPISLMSGWMDQTATSSIHAFYHAAKAPGSELVIGPWSHSGFLDNRVGHVQSGKRSRFNHLTHAISFFDRCLGRQTDADTMDELAEADAADSAGEGPAAVRAMTALAGEAALPAQASQDRESDSEPSSADDAAAEGEGTSELTSTAMEDAKTPVHYFVMGPEAGWHSTSAWPPPELAPEPYTLFLGRSSREGLENGDSSGTVSDTKERMHGALMPNSGGPSLRWEHKVELWKHPKGFSRYDAMIRLTRSIRYTHLRSCGHLTFVGAPLEQSLTLVGWPTLTLWVESSDADADLFAYLEDQDPDTGKARYVTEGCFRVSHRAEKNTEGLLRAAATLPGAPFHDFKKTSAEPIPSGQAVQVRFQLMPTAYTFAKGHHVRLAISGADPKHFHVDHKGKRTFWVHTSPEHSSCLQLPCKPQI